jgi:hypothetical protein
MQQRPGSVSELRARAARVRGYAYTFAGDEAEERLLQFADELEARADAVEQASGNSEPVDTRLAA